MAAVLLRQVNQLLQSCSRGIFGLDSIGR